jgi:ABC-type antimicrobial peptide transport system permease subunit
MHKFYRIVRTAFRALRRNILRSALTTLGIVIGVAAVIAMTEVGQGSSSTVQNNRSPLDRKVLCVPRREHLLTGDVNQETAEFKDFA